MTAQAMTWYALGVYIAVTVYLTIQGMLKTKSLESFAVGSGNVSSVAVGLSLSVQLTSVATFVVNPGLVYHYGISGLLGFGVAAALGITVGLIIFSFRFRTAGSQVKALTVPQWIGARYESKALRIFFAFLSMCLIAFAVLIVVAISLVLANLLQVSPQTIVMGIVIFVFTYVMLGGVNTSVYTNTIQAAVMVVVALILIKSGFSGLFDGSIFAKLGKEDANLLTIVNPTSLYFRNLFEVFFCNFIVGIAIVCQPHILSKALYLKNDRQVVNYLIVAALAGTVFASVMLVGLYARAELGSGIRADFVVPTYIVKMFSPGMQTLIGMGILCAGLSTLEGILLAISAIASSDIYIPFSNQELNAETGRKALYFGRKVLIAVGIITVILSNYQIAHPTGGSVAIFAQYGIYLLFTASFFPLAAGMFFPKVSKSSVVMGIITSIVVYLLVSALKITSFSNNPAFLATMGILAGWIVMGFELIINKQQEI